MEVLSMADKDKYEYKFRVPWQETCWSCQVDSLNFQCTDELAPLDHFIGQERALEAIRFGLEVDKPGYNLFVTGLSGTGKASAIQDHLQRIVDDLGKQKPINDWVYVHNFDDLDRPQVLRLPMGTGKTFCLRLTGILDELKEEVPKSLKSEEYESQRSSLQEAARQAVQQLTDELEKAAQTVNFGVRIDQAGATIFPLTDNRSMTAEEYQELDPQQRKAIDDIRVGLMQKTQASMTEAREVEKSAAEDLKRLDRVVAGARVSEVFRELLDGCEGIPDMEQYLLRLISYVLDNLDLFKGTETTVPQPSPAPVPRSASATSSPNPFLPFEMNILVDNTEVSVPIVFEPNPNWGNLFGRIERRALMGTYFSDHTMLKGGSIHLANGGYLVLNARDILNHPGVWEGLKRVIRNREVGLEDPAEQAGFFVPQGMRPQSVPLDVTVIVMGDESIYRMLTAADQEDFRDLFKVKAEFNDKVDLTPENLKTYCAFICRICHEEGLLPFHASGAAGVVEFAARLVSDQKKLSARFGQIKDLLIEADYWARKDSSELVHGEHVKQALDHKVHRLNLIEERMREMIGQGTVLLETAGAVVGQVNGLAVYDLGDISFGLPTRITAQTFAGRDGVINIEREASLSGRTHDKGVLILSGYLGAKFGQDRPLTLSASLAFEQSYEGVDGDSASSTELYAILSSLSGLPLQQNIAVTGSVNQKGEIQPIGGVNQKIEGMFDLCRLDGLTGDQGVMIPHQNLRNLMLREDVVEAIREGKFHIYAVKTISEGLEVLTGYPAGEPQVDGTYPEGTVNYLVAKRLLELNQSMRGYYAEVLAGVS
jgi:predicted ATP-dependent protease